MDVDKKKFLRMMRKCEIVYIIIIGGIIRFGFGGIFGIYFFVIFRCRIVIVVGVSFFFIFICYIVCVLFGLCVLFIIY